MRTNKIFRILQELTGIRGTERVREYEDGVAVCG